MHINFVSVTCILKLLISCGILFPVYTSVSNWHAISFVQDILWFLLKHEFFCSFIHIFFIKEFYSYEKQNILYVGVSMKLNPPPSSPSLPPLQSNCSPAGTRGLWAVLSPHLIPGTDHGRLLRRTPLPSHL